MRLIDWGKIGVIFHKKSSNTYKIMVSRGLQNLHPPVQIRVSPLKKQLKTSNSRLLAISTGTGVILVPYCIVWGNSAILDLE